MSPQPQIESSAHALDDLLKYYARTFGTSQDNFWRLVNSVRVRSFLLQPQTNRRNGPLPSIEGVLLACARMAKRHAHWHRMPESWSPPRAGLFVQFRSLVQHLFDVYEVPAFMASVWKRQKLQTWEVDLYLHLATGQSVRRFSRWTVEYRMTKRAAACFMQAPDDLQPFEAYRWSQIRSLGGDARLARVVSTRSILQAPTTDEMFWESVLRFLVSNQPLCADEVLEIIQFINRQRFQPSSAILRYLGDPEPLQPEFTLKGRTIMSLRRHMTNWRSELQTRYTMDATQPQVWSTSDIKPFRFEHENSLWTIDELLTDKELRVEGGMMQHCVATYSQRCSRRRTTIWSLKRHRGEQRKRMVTIEVIPATRIIWQTQGKRNTRPDGEAMQIIQRWAYEEGLMFRRKA